MFSDSHCDIDGWLHSHFLNLLTQIPPLLDTKTHRSFLCFLALGESGNQYSEAADVPEPIAWNSDSALRLCWVWGSVCDDT